MSQPEYTPYWSVCPAASVCTFSSAPMNWPLTSLVTCGSMKSLYSRL